MDKLNILFVHHHRKHKFEYRAIHFAEKLVEKGHDVTAICTSEKNHFKGLTYVQNGVQYFESPDLFRGRLRSGWCVWSLLSRIHFLKNKDFDLIVTFETRPTTIYPVLHYKRKKDVPLIIDWADWWGRGGLITENRPKLYQLLFGSLETYYEEKFRKIADATVVISDGLIKRAISLGVPPDSIFEIPNGASTDEIKVSDPQKFRKKYDLPGNSFIVCDSGKDVLIGVDLILKSIKEALKSDKDIIFIMTGFKKAELTQKANTLGLNNNFKHFGFVPKKDLPEILSCANLFIIPFEDKPSNLGRWPGKIGKYLSLGKPVISNPVGVMKKVITEGKIGLLAEEDPVDIASKIIQLKTDNKLYNDFCHNARRYAETKLQWRMLTDQFENCIRYALDHNNKE
jgi:glycosyltransferase involved in cell wall biosynthesis